MEYRELAESMAEREAMLTCVVATATALYYSFPPVPVAVVC